MSPSEKIPHPLRYPLLGNLPYVFGSTPVQSFLRIARDQGPIFEMKMPHGYPVFISSHEFVSQLCDDKLFDKSISMPLKKLKELGGEGLFTSKTKNKNWQESHRVLVPAFKHEALKNYYPSMLKVAKELISYWSNKSQGQIINITEDMTRLTFDTIGLCGFAYQFRSFESEQAHPFIKAMNRALVESLSRVRRPVLVSKLLYFRKRQFQKDIELMHGVVEEVIQKRKQSNHTGDPDFLELMLQSPAALDDHVIRDQVITFLVAGHETTSGLLSFALYFLMKNPEILKNAWAEVDAVLADRDPVFEDLSQLKYIQQILKESLRLWPTAPIFSRFSHQDVLLGGRYLVKAGTDCNVLLPALHRDPEIWQDPERFDPDRFTAEAERSRPAHCYKPFGHGKRVCIGKQFAMLESTLALAMILQSFELKDEFNYSLKVVESLTLKPGDFKVTLKKRIRAHKLKEDSLLQVH
jgi:cytochrome P450 / NADPH-cytochrome P450 reductase